MDRRKSSEGLPEITHLERVDHFPRTQLNRLEQCAFRKPLLNGRGQPLFLLPNVSACPLIDQDFRFHRDCAHTAHDHPEKCRTLFVKNIFHGPTRDGGERHFNSVQGSAAFFSFIFRIRIRDFLLPPSAIVLSTCRWARIISFIPRTRR